MVSAAMCLGVVGNIDSKLDAGDHDKKKPPAGSASVESVLVDAGNSVLFVRNGAQTYGSTWLADGAHLAISVETPRVAVVAAN